MLIDQRLFENSTLIRETDSFFILLKHDELPWVVIVSKKMISEFYELTNLEQTELLNFSNTISQFFKRNFDKVNVANLGNVVSHFHWHIVARLKTDRAWPGPIWGTSGNQVDNEIILKRTAELIKLF
jgi:diadenosine tetraphosphate (Ap4A) HIT family hydrolase